VENHLDTLDGPGNGVRIAHVAALEVEISSDRGEVLVAARREIVEHTYPPAFCQ
jgi:hypothetical protein